MAGRCWLAGLLVLCAATTARAQPRPELRAVDRYVRAEMEAARIPGVALAIVQWDRVVRVRGYGRAAPDATPVTPQTPFILGSTSKSFTALAVMQLVEAGKLDLDTPVRQYLPWFTPADERVTVRHLLHHTSGFTTAAGRAFSTDNDNSPGALERLTRALRPYGSRHNVRPPGDQYEYSNANYLVLGMLVQEVSGLPFEDYLREHVLNPLSMATTFTDRALAARRGLATGHRLWFGHPVAADGLPWTRGGLPYGMLISSADDLSRYLIAQLNGGRYGDAALLSSVGMAAMHTPGPVATGPGFYGMGWATYTLGGEPAVGHRGDMADYFSDLVFLPKSGWGVAVLANANSYLLTDRLHTLADGIVLRLLGQEPQVATQPPAVWAYYAAALVVAAIVLAGAYDLFKRLIAWYRAPLDARPPRRPWPVGLTLARDLIIAAIIFLGLPLVFDTPLSGMLLSQPDLMLPLVVVGGLLVLGAVARTAASYWLLQPATVKKL